MTLSAQVADQGDREFVVGPSKLTREIVDLVGKIAKASTRMRRSSRSTSPPSQGSSSKARCSGTSADRSPARSSSSLANSSWPLAARCSWTKSAISRSSSRPSYCVRFRRGDRTRRRRQAYQDRLPADRGDQRRPGKGRKGGTIPGGSLLPDQRHSHQASAVARPHGRSPGACPLLPESL